MGCFLGCFARSKDRKRRKQRNKIIPRDQQERHGGYNSLQSTVSTEQAVKVSPPTNSVSELRDKPGEELSQLSSSTRKKVTFNSNVTTYEHVSVVESVESLPESKEISEKEKDEILVKLNKSESEDDSVTSSVESYPPNHRYQNCRDSDDEAEEFGDSDLEDDDEDYSDYDDYGDDRIIGQKVLSESVVTASMESRTDILSNRGILEEVESPMKTSFLPNQEVKTPELNRNARNRSDYVHPVLNPVENLTQWKRVKSKGNLQLKSQKENFTEELEAPRMSFTFSSEPNFMQSSSSFKSKSDQCKSSNQEIAVDASLSTWLVGPESTPTKASLSSLESITCEKVSSMSQGSNSVRSLEDRPILGALTVGPESTPTKASLSSLESITCEKVSSMSQGSNSVRSLEDRPILGALTVEELKQLSASSSPRRSPSRSPDEMPIIGTVGTYWNTSSYKRLTKH